MEGHVRKRGDKYYYSFEGPKINGKRKRYERVGGKTKKEAYSALRKALEEFESTARVFDSSNLSVHDYLNFWYDDYVVRNLKYNSQVTYKRLIDGRISPLIGKYKLSAVTPHVLQKVIDKETDDGASKQTVSIIKAIITSSFKRAVYPYEFIKTSPAQYLVMPKFDKRKSSTKDSLKVFTMEDFSKMQQHVSPEDSFYIPMHIAFHTGLRRGEVSALTWEDINFHDRTINIDKIIVDKTDGYSIDTPKTQSSYRVIDIGETLVKLLKKHKMKQSERRLFYGSNYIESNFICTHPNGELVVPHSLSYYCRKTKWRSGVDFTFHSFRHTHATMLLENGAKMKDVQYRLGHSSILTTMDTYAHVTKKTKKATVDLFENYLEQE